MSTPKWVLFFICFLTVTSNIVYSVIWNQYYTKDVPVLILLIHLDTFYCLEAETLLIFHNSPKYKFYGAFGVGYYYTRF